MKKRVLTPAAVIVVLALSACNAASGTVAPTEPPTPVPTVPPTPISTAEPSCPGPRAGTQLLRHEEHGYCLLYPDGLVRVDTPPYQICLVPEGPAMACHTAVALVEVTDAAGRSADQIADEWIANSEAEIPGIVIQRTSLTVSGQQAVVLEGLPGVASTRDIVIVQTDRLYKLTFVFPGPEDAPATERFELTYETIIDSFTFVPTVPSAAPTEASQSTGGSAVVVFVEAGNVHVWEEDTGERRTIIDSGDAIRVELSDDAELVAFLRRSYFEAGGFDNNEQSALWVVGLDGSNPRELVSAAELRQQVGAAEADSSNFPRLDWIPNTHRLLYSGNTYDAHGYGEGAHTALKGGYSIDADTGASAELAPAGTGFHFVPSPDGRLVALVDTTGLLLLDVDSGRQRLEFPAGPVVGDTGWFAGAGVWTQDSSAFVINALVEPGNAASDYALWRVPADGSSGEALITFSSGGGSVVYAPDGSSAAMLISASGIGPSVWAFTPLPEDLGALAVPSDVNDYSQFNWSPAGTAYVIEPLVFDSASVMHGRENLFPLCPNAVQAIEVCGPAIPFGEQIEWLEWVDRDRFLYVTYEPRRLYLGSVEGSATMIAEDPPSFAAAAATCRDDSEFVTDVTVPDGTHFAPGTVFQKTWRLRNSGTCIWDDSYRLAYLAGERMSGPRTSPLGDPNISQEGLGLFPTVLPGEEIDVSVMLSAPEAAGTYSGQWQLFAPDGTPFGTRPYVLIVVP